MIIGLDHVVILVADLARATHLYQALGFQVERGGVHPAWGTENALIALADGTYLELLAPRQQDQAVRSQLWQRGDGHARTPGEFGDYAMRSDDLLRDVDRLKAAAVDFDGPQAGSRERPDGQLIRWRSAFLELGTLPFLIQDDGPRELRISPPRSGVGADAHLSEVTIAVDDLAETVNAYKALLCIDASTDGGFPDTVTVRFPTPWGTLRVVQPGRVDPVRGQLERVGPGVLSVTLAVRGWEELTRTLAPIVTAHGGKTIDIGAATGGPQVLLRPR